MPQSFSFSSLNRPVKPDVVRKGLRIIARSSTFNPRPGLRGAMRGHMADAIGDDGLRRLTLGWLFTQPGEIIKPISTTDLTEPQLIALQSWVGATPINTSPENGGKPSPMRWEPAKGWEQEVKWCSWQAESDYNAQVGKMSQESVFVDTAQRLGGIVTKKDKAEPDSLPRRPKTRRYFE